MSFELLDILNDKTNVSFKRKSVKNSIFKSINAITNVVLINIKLITEIIKEGINMITH